MTDEYFTKSEAQAKVGKQVRTLIEFSDVPKGTSGECYDNWGRIFLNFRQRMRGERVRCWKVVVMKGGRRQRNVRGCVIADKAHPPFVAQARKRGSGWHFSWRPATKLADE